MDGVKEGAQRCGQRAELSLRWPSFPLRCRLRLLKTGACWASWANQACRCHPCRALGAQLNGAAQCGCNSPFKQPATGGLKPAHTRTPASTPAGGGAGGSAAARTSGPRHHIQPACCAPAFRPGRCVKMSSQLVWEIVKKNNSFLRRSVNHTVFSAEPGNL